MGGSAVTSIEPVSEPPVQCRVTGGPGPVHLLWAREALANHAPPSRSLSFLAGGGEALPPSAPTLRGTPPMLAFAPLPALQASATPSTTGAGSTGPLGPAPLRSCVSRGHSNVYCVKFHSHSPEHALPTFSCRRNPSETEANLSFHVSFSQREPSHNSTEQTHTV